MTSAIIIWLVQSTVLVTLVSTILLVSHRWVLKQWGAGTTYLLWMLVPLAMLLPLFCYALGYAVWFTAPQSALASNPLANLLPPAFTYSTLNPGFDTPLANAAQARWMLGLLVIWLVPAISLLGIYCYHLMKSASVRITYVRGLPVEYTPAGNSPALVGLLHPHIQLPEDFTQRYSTQQRRLMLAHELSHWRNGDLRYNALAWFCLALQWFNPSAWMAYRRFRADQELACDTRVLRDQKKTSPHLCYANALLAALQCALPQASTGGTNAVISTQYGHRGDRTMYQERIKQLQDNRRTQLKPVLIAVVCASLITSAWLIPTATASLQSTSLQSSVESPNTNTLESSTLHSEERPITPIVRINPRYPEEAAAQGIEGHVDFEIVIDSAGNVANIEVLNAEPEGIFEEEAITALQRWRFAPQDDVSHRLRIEFSLQNNS